MTEVTVSSKYRLVIPKDVRRQVPLWTGQKLSVVAKGGLRKIGQKLGSDPKAETSHF